MPGGGQHGIHRITQAAFESAAIHVPIGFHVADHRLHRRASAQLATKAPGFHPAPLSRMEDLHAGQPQGTLVAAVDVTVRRTHTAEDLRLLQRLVEGVAIVGAGTP